VTEALIPQGDQRSRVVFIPKRRKKKAFGVVRRHLGDVFHELARQQESKIEEGHLHLHHVHICISIPPKYAVSNVMGYIKGKSAISIARNLMGRRRNFTGENFWARGYFVSTVGLDEETVKEYIRTQEKEDERVDQLSLGFEDRSPSGDS
jgi:putative transposase